MVIDPAPVLALISDLTTRLVTAEHERDQLRAALATRTEELDLALAHVEDGAYMIRDGALVRRHPVTD